MPQQDVIIVGAGSWGLSCAYACAKRGMQVVVLEANTIGSGASGGIVGALAPHVPDEWNEKKQFQYEALKNAGTFWSDVDALSGCGSGYGQIGRVVALQTPRARELALRRVETSRDLWEGKFHWTVEDGHPFLAENLTPFGVALETMSARLFPKAAVQSLAGACKKLGVEIRENCVVTEVSETSATGSFGKLSAKSVVLAGGVGGGRLFEKFHPGTASDGVKGQAALLDIHLQCAPQIYAEGVYVIPHGPRGVAVGSTSEREFINGTETDEKLDAVLETARALCPPLAKALVLQRWAGVRPKMSLPDAMLGPVPGHPGIIAALGGFKIGLGLAPKVGEVVADYIEGKQPHVPHLFTMAHHLK